MEDLPDNDSFQSLPSPTDQRILDQIGSFSDEFDDDDLKMGSNQVQVGEIGDVEDEGEVGEFGEDYSSERDSHGDIKTKFSNHKDFSQTTSFRTGKSSMRKNAEHKYMGPQICERVAGMLKREVPIGTIQDQLNISSRAMKKMHAQWVLYGKVEPTKGSKGNPRVTLQKQKEYEQVQTILRNVIGKNCGVTLKHMQKALKQQNIFKSRSTIHAYLERMRYSRKKLQKIPLERNSKQKLIYRQKYCQMIRQIPLVNQIFLDQTVFGLQTSGNYGWAPKGQQPKLYVPSSRRKHITLLAAVSIRGFEATRILKGPATSKHVTQFLEHYLDHLESHEVLILDNARVHHAAIVKQKISELRRPVRYIPAYTPQLNPIQNIFSQIKSQYIRLKEDQQLKTNEMIKLIEDAIKNMRSKEFSKYYEHYEQWLKKGEAGELFI